MGKVVEVFCYAQTLIHNYPVEDTSLLLLKFETGALGVVDSHFSVPDASSENRLEVYGSKGSILAKGTIGQNSSGHVVARVQREEKAMRPPKEEKKLEGKRLSWNQ